MRYLTVPFQALASVFLVLIVCTVISGCVTNPEATRDRLGVQAATMALIERSDDHAAKARAVIDTVDKARTLLDFETVATDDIRVALLARVAERDLTPLERLAAVELVNAVADEVEARLGSGVLTVDQRVSVNTVLGWVENAALAYVPK